MIESLLIGLFAVILVTVIIGAVFIYSTVAWGLVLFKFWGWFVLPVFTTLPEITFVQALGLMFFIGLFKTLPPSIKKEYKEKHADSITILLAPWICLFFGWMAYVIF